MPNYSFRNAARILAATTLVLMATLAVLQRSPAVRQGLGFEDASAATHNALPDAPPPADEEWSVFSGSAVTRDSFAAPEPIENSTIQIELPPAGTAPPADLARKLAAIQHRLDEALADRPQPCPTDSSEIVDAVARLEAHAAELKAQIAELQQVRRQPMELPNAGPRLVIQSRIENGRPRITIEAHDASLPELLARLGQAAGKNLLVAPSVTGNVSVHLDLPDAEAGLAAVCRTHRCKLEQSGPLTIVSRLPDIETRPIANLPETMTKLYRLKHLSAQIVRPYVIGLLTPEVGSVSFASIRERVQGTVYKDPPRAILVKDTPDVIAAVDRLILELDQPENGKRSPGGPKPRSPALPISHTKPVENGPTCAAPERH
jgi:hypothetical protein